MMKKSSYALHKIDDQNRLPFSATDYSKFKFGSKNVAREFGHDLGRKFTKEFMEPRLNSWRGKQIVVLSSPYCFIPTATFAMKDYFVDVLNQWLVEHDLLVVQEAKIHRTITYKEDYGALSAEERMKLIGGDSFHIDREFVKGKILFFLDDIKITGSHERVIERMCQEYNLKNECVFLYYAELTNKNIHPKIENYLNYHYVDSLLKIDKIIKNENFLLNTRTTKYILNSNPGECNTFLNYQSQKFLESLYHCSIGNSYHLIEDYKINLLQLANILKQYNNA